MWPQAEWKFGGSLGFPGIGLQAYPAAFTLGAHAQYFPQGPGGLEASLGLAPLGLAFDALIMGGRAGVAVPLRTESLMVLPSAGVSLIAGASRNGLEPGVAFFYAGLATLHVGGLRVGATLHWRHPGQKPVWLVEFGGIRLRSRRNTPPRD